MSTAEIREIFQDPLFTSVRKFALSGGEPTLRDDIADIVDIILESCPQVSEIALLTNGLEPTNVVSKARELVTLPKLHGSSKLTIQVSLDGFREIHEKIRRVPQAFERTIETIKMLKDLQLEMPFYLCLTCVVQPSNIDNLVQLAEFGQEIELPINFVPIDLRGMIANQPENGANGDHLPRLTVAHWKKLKTLFSEQLQPYLKPSNIPFWHEYFAVLEGNERKLPCFLVNHYIGVDSDGTLYLCCRDIPSMTYGNAKDEAPHKIWFSTRARKMRNNVKAQFCPNCSAGCDTAFSFKQEFFFYARFLIKERVRDLLG